MPSPVVHLLAALACAAVLSACSSEKPLPPESPPEAPPAYDGPWTPLPETGEWTDPGVLSSCIPPGPAASGCQQGSALMHFDVSGCDLGAFSAQEPRGAIYLAELRADRGDGNPVPESGGFLFDASGKPRTLMGQPADNAEANWQVFRLTASSGFLGQRTEDYTFQLCQAPDSRTLTGCYAWCRNGRLYSQGTFRAERMTWPQGEPESSGLSLVSETYVPRGRPVDVYVTRGHAYVVSTDNPNDTGGLTVFDLSDPRAPVQRASFQLPGDTFWNGVWAKDHALYIASGDAGVLVYDITDPARPAMVRSEKGGIVGAVDVHTVFVEGDRLYAMSPSARRTLIFDVSEPLSPRLLSSYTYPNGDGFPHDAFAFAGRLYINHMEDGFLVVDTQGELPSLLGQYGYTHAVSHANAVGTINGRTVAFEGGETLGAHLRVLDVTDPAHIVKIGEYRKRRITSIHNMLLVGTRLYVAWYHEGVRVLDVSDPSQPREVAHYNTFRESDPDRTDSLFHGAIGIRVPGDGHVYVVDKARGLLILDAP
ncbi:LVIVD repeat-containing protein [Pyxidicoccus xibeiensis]|uniref:LVIVD repeat-containing protein n=1 Tax=Pyxidicoccus xibeiensis TaxID=2906759 RepID=UPI0020A6E275|nr:hypothetical protein [Pyxidicoccus xibeiensis]MCP3144983.1 hypothetical protein [Pyxidicoccus xibeiensis]